MKEEEEEEEEENSSAMSNLEYSLDRCDEIFSRKRLLPDAVHRYCRGDDGGKEGGG